MKINEKTLNKLNELIIGNGKTDYKKGQELVIFFNQFGYQDEYESGFPSRHIYSKNKLTEINNSNRIETVIENYFDPINFIENKSSIDEIIKNFNEYLIFDNLELVINNNSAKILHQNQKSDLQSTDKDLERIWRKDESYKVFLSHKKEFKKETGVLKENLSKYGISCFVAHQDIETNQIWQDEIERAIFSADAFIALMTKEFHSSNWTDQEIGIAYGRKIPIVAIRLGKDPYGFIGKFQGLQIDIENNYLEIIKLFMKYPKMIDAYISKIENSPSYTECNNLAMLLPYIDYLNDEQIKRLLQAYRTNSQVSDSYGFKGKYPSGFGINELLKKITGLDYHL